MFFISISQKTLLLNTLSQKWYKNREPSDSPSPVLPLTINHRYRRTDKRRHNRRRNNPRRVHTSILASVSNHIHRYQLQGRNIQNQKRTHLIAGNSLPLPFLPASRFHTAVYRNPIRRIPSRPPLLLQLRQFLHGLQSALCQVNDTKFKKSYSLTSLSSISICFFYQPVLLL